MPLSPPNALRADSRNLRASSATPVVAVAVALLAFALYRVTLLPGVDFGDTGSFQTTVGSPILTPRVGYPLYFAIAGAFLGVTRSEPAHALNLVTAIEGAVACGLFVFVAADLAGSLVAAAAAALLFAVSYTFWSQCVMAEVYALHAALVLGSLWLLLLWERRPSALRLAAFFACYAIGFGNHLSMILLLPAFTVFLLISAPGGWRSMLTPRVVALAVGCALIGASQYIWNLRSLWFQPDPPSSVWDALRTFWFDVTKSDWRETMVLEVPQSLLKDHVAMYWFDLRQQFGLAGPLLAVAGATGLALARPRRAILLGLLFAVNVLFAFSYNVGDTHVFYLPSHLFIALLAAAGLTTLERLSPRIVPIAAVGLALYAGVRGYRDFPALNRSHDTRPTDVLRTLTHGVDDQRAILLVDLNWQIANGLSYFAKSVRPDVAVARLRDVLLYAPALVRDNLAIGRHIALSDNARRLLDESYGPLLTAAVDVAAPTFEETVRAIAPGTRSVACVLKPSRDMPLDRHDLDAALRVLSPGGLPLPADDYVVVAGVAGEPASAVVGSNRPFTRTVQVGGVDADVRMESWLASDTIRRMGFGHVIVARQHTLIVERGISFATFGPDGVPTRTAYFAGIFAAPRRYLIR